jgi:hypothetical protein
LAQTCSKRQQSVTASTGASQGTLLPNHPLRLRRISTSNMQAAQAMGCSTSTTHAQPPQRANIRLAHQIADAPLGHKRFPSKRRTQSFLAIETFRSTDVNNCISQHRICFLEEQNCAARVSDKSFTFCIRTHGGIYIPHLPRSRARSGRLLLQHLPDFLQGSRCASPNFRRDLCRKSPEIPQNFLQGSRCASPNFRRDLCRKSHEKSAESTCIPSPFPAGGATTSSRRQVRTGKSNTSLEVPTSNASNSIHRPSRAKAWRVSQAQLLHSILVGGINHVKYLTAFPSRSR